MKTVQMIKSAAKLVDECLCVKRGEKVVIVTDLNKVSISEVIASVLYERGIDFSLCIMTPRSRHSENPPAPITAAMTSADAVIMPTTFSLTHAEARRNANEKGARVLSLPSYTKEVMMSEALLDVDFKKMRPIVSKCAKKLTDATTVHITTESGTDLRISLKGKKSIHNDCIVDKPGTWASAPGMEAAIAPVEDSTTGILVLDGVLIPGGVVEDKVKVEFDKGKIKSISGGVQADEFRKLLVGYNDPNVYYAVELGVGLNPKSKLGRNMIESESVYGTIHIGLGEGRTFGSKITANAHLDLVLAFPQLELDGEIVISDRKLLFI